MLVCSPIIQLGNENSFWYFDKCCIRLHPEADEAFVRSAAYHEYNTASNHVIGMDILSKHIQALNIFFSWLTRID